MHDLDAADNGTGYRQAASPTLARKASQGGRKQTTIERYPAVCSRCYQVIDLMALSADVQAGRLPVLHDCGRVLVSRVPQ